MEWFQLFIIGMIIGLANIIPGVSGGTMAVICGVFDRLIGAVSNIRKEFKKSILFLIPMFVYKESPYTKFHVNQGIVLCILDVAGGIVLGIVSAVLGWIPFVGWIISGLLSLAFGVFVLVLMILGIVNAATGKAEPLPIIGKIVIYK